MIKKIFLTIICLFLFVTVVFSKEVAVKISPVKVITTSDLKLKIGDCVEFSLAEDINLNSKCLKKGDKVYGIVTSREENGFLGQVASVYIENFYIKDSCGKRIKLKGVIYKKGTCHDVITGFLQLFLVVIRGGEVWIKPGEDLFTLYAEVS